MISGQLDFPNGISIRDRGRRGMRIRSRSGFKSGIEGRDGGEASIQGPGVGAFEELGRIRVNEGADVGFEDEFEWTVERFGRADEGGVRRESFSMAGGFVYLRWLHRLRLRWVCRRQKQSRISCP